MAHRSSRGRATSGLRGSVPCVGISVPAVAAAAGHVHLGLVGPAHVHLAQTPPSGAANSRILRISNQSAIRTGSDVSVGGACDRDRFE
jgi:hypothetical protein